MGENTGFALVNNSIHENQNGAIFLNGEISDGVIEGNRIENNSGARNLTAGLVLCSMPIEDIETAYNPFPDEMLYDILQSPISWWCAATRLHRTIPPAFIRKAAT